MKSVYVDNIENREILLSQVKLDLKSCGIKVSKSKLKLKPEPVVSNGSIFGNWLCFLQCCDVPNCGKVPSFLIDTLEEIEKHILTEGLFRKSGSAARQKELKQIVDDGGSIANAHPLDLAGLLKQFFRELPDSLLPSPLDELFLRCCCLTATADRLHSLLQICLLLPHRHLAVMRYIMQFLWRVTLHCNQNKMDAANLAICLTPNFLHNCLRNFDDKTMTTSGADGKMLKLAIDGMQMLIENADHIGMVEEHLSEHLATVSRSCVCSDDEVNKCEDIGKVRKRKKRSTSLQGLVTNLSSSFSKWRRNSRGHNSSSISNHSTLSSASCAPGEDVTIVLATTDDPDEDMIDLPDVTPKVMRKRKADEEEMIVAFSATKKKAILQKLPQLNSPYTPMNKRNYASEFKDPPNLTFTDNTDLIFSATPSRPRVEQFLAATSAAKRDSLKSNIKTNVSPKASTANANSMRRSVKKFFRRLSSGKETEQPSDDQVAVNLSNGRKHKKTPSSPARLITHLLPADNSPLHMPARSEDKPLDNVNDSCTTPQPNNQNHNGSASLQRGKPNSIKSGLPASHQFYTSHTDEENMQKRATVLSETANLLGASPILHHNNSNSDIINEDGNIERSKIHGLLRCSSGSVSSFELNTSVHSEPGNLPPELEESFHDVAFLQDSVIMQDGVVATLKNSSKESSLPEEYLDNVDGKVANIKHATVEEIHGFAEIETINDSGNIPSLDTLLKQIENDADSLKEVNSSNRAKDCDKNLNSFAEKFKEFRFIKPQTPEPNLHITPSMGSLLNRAQILNNSSKQFGESPEVARTSRESILNLKDSGRVAARVGEYNRLGKDGCIQLASRHASPVRFVNTANRGKPVVSPLKIPCAFLKSDNKEASNEEVPTTNNENLSRIKDALRSPKIPISSNVLRNLHQDIPTCLPSTANAMINKLATSAVNVKDGPERSLSSAIELSRNAENREEGKLQPLKESNTVNVQHDFHLVTVKSDSFSASLPPIKQQLMQDMALKYSHAARLRAAEGNKTGMPIIGVGFRSSPVRRVKRLNGSPLTSKRSLSKVPGSPAKLLVSSKQVPVAKWDI